jgi:uncharacterized protein YndB with AHSA1/START domain
MELTQPPIVKTQMLIRRPAAEVFEAFVDPAVTTNFWFTRSSGRLEPGARIEWAWEMYGVATEVRVLEVEPHRRIVIEWDEPPTTVEWTFADRGGGTTMVQITNHGFAGSGDEVVSQALDSMGGFGFVLAGLKAWLEHGVALNLIADHHPEANVVR